MEKIYFVCFKSSVYVDTEGVHPIFEYNITSEEFYNRFSRIMKFVRKTKVRYYWCFVDVDKT